MRGKGLGLICLKKSIDLFKKNFSDCKTLNAFVKLNNIPSIKIFKSLGFEVIKRKNSFMSLVFRFLLKLRMDHLFKSKLILGTAQFGMPMV